LLSDGPTQTVTVTNVGGSPLTVTDVTVVSTIALADYTIAADTCSDIPLAPAKTCQVTVTFSPTASGDRPAVLRFADNAPGGDAHLIGLAGKGGTPVLQLSPAVTQPGRVVTVTGTGFAPNRTVAITIAGSPETATAVADATGAFSQALLIFPKSSVGNRLVAGTIDGTALKAERPLLIVTPTVTPADFVVRG
jgi:alpha-L-fucosidase